MSYFLALLLPATSLNFVTVAVPLRDGSQSQASAEVADMGIEQQTSFHKCLMDLSGIFCLC